MGTESRGGRGPSGAEGIEATGLPAEGIELDCPLDIRWNRWVRGSLGAIGPRKTPLFTKRRILRARLRVEMPRNTG